MGNGVARGQGWRKRGRDGRDGERGGRRRKDGAFKGVFFRFDVFRPRLTLEIRRRGDSIP